MSSIKLTYKGTLCLSVCTPHPQKVIGIIEIVSFIASNFMIFVKNSGGGREVNMINTLLKINLSKIGWKGGWSTPFWIMGLNILRFFLEITPYTSAYDICSPIDIYGANVVCYNAVQLTLLQKNRYFLIYLGNSAKLTPN